MSLREEIVKILGYKEPLICDGNHPRGKCKLEKVKAILSLFSKAVEEVKPKKRKMPYNSTAEEFERAISYNEGVSDYHKGLNALLKETI